MGGVIGDDGIKNIKIGNLNKVSKSFLNFQKFLKRLKSRGILLAYAQKILNRLQKMFLKKKCL